MCVNLLNVCFSSVLVCPHKSYQFFFYRETSLSYKNKLTHAIFGYKHGRTCLQIT